MQSLSHPRCPYQGLIPYEEGDAQFFFGREHETQVIIANLFASSLTLLYGASGVGKSSILRAGVTHGLSHREDLLVVVFRTWQSKPVDDLKAAVANAATARRERMLRVAQSKRLTSPANFSDAPESSANLSEHLEFWSEKLDCSLLIILDQFEEYFLYHPDDDAFVVEFSQAVSRSKAPISFLISIREDALAKLDRFEKGIPGVFDNYLRLDHLDRKAAEAAILEPLKHYNKLLGANGAKKIEIEDQLVTEVLNQVKTGEVQLVEAGRGDRDLGSGDTKVETPFLQMVMTRLWKAEMDQGSNVLRVQTLKQLGDAERIICTHLDDAMSTLTADEQAIAANVFRYLVTPSGSKIAHSASNLFYYTGLPPYQITPVLNKLSGKPRILQPVAPTAAPDAPPHYEIYHDVLATAILDWRRRFMQIQEWTKNKEEIDQEQRRVSHWRLGLIALLLLIGAFIFSLYMIYSSWTRERKAVSRELAAVSLNHLSTDSELSVLLALKAVETEPTDEAIKSLRESLAEYPLLNVVKTRFVARYASFSPNGRFLLTGGGEQTAHLWDAITGVHLKTFVGRRGQLLTATFSPDGTLIATGTNFTTPIVQIWDTNSDTQALAELIGHTRDVRQVVFSADSRLVLTASEDHTARIWDARIGQNTASFMHPDIVNQAKFNPDASLVVTACADGNAYIWETSGGRVKQTIPVGDIAYDASFSPDGRTIVVATRSGFARVYDVETGQNTLDFTHDGQVYRVWFSFDGRYILTLDRYNSIYVWDVNSNHVPVGKITSHFTENINHPAFSPDGQLIACGVGNNTGIWDLTGKEIKTLTGNSAFVYDTTFSRDGYRLATASKDGTARIWRIRKPRDFYDVGGAPVSFSPDGRFIMTSNQIWDFVTGDRVEDPLLDGYSIYRRDLLSKITANADIDSAELSSDGKFLLTLSNDHSLQIRNVHTGETVVDLKDDSISRSAAFSPDGRYIVTGSEKGNAQIWDTQNGTRRVKELAGHSAPLITVTYSPDGKFVLGESDDRTVMIWDVRTGERRAKLQGHFGGFSPDSQLLVITTNGEAQVWEWAAADSVSPVILESAYGDIMNATFSPDGMFVVASTASNVAKTFARESFVTVAELKKMARTRLQRSLELTCDERTKYLHQRVCLW